ncbi:MAG: hypothetical protein KF760_23160 [Candidatus Eremiobacteraeota bacterium]|nr:hypothetical protein [Candidatus Eremiobacteraeota bacterium]
MRVWRLGEVPGDWRGAPRVQQMAARGNLRALFGWSPAPAWGAPSAAVVHGVQYSVPSAVFGPAHGRGVLWCDDLRLDLSLENVVEDEVWKAHLETLKEVYESV